MKKLLSSVLILFFIVSCTTIRHLKNQDIQSINGTANFVDSKNLVLLNTLIDGNNSVLLLDTGAQMSVIFDSTSVENFGTKKIGTLGEVKGIDGKTAGLRTFTALFESELFKSDNKAFAYIHKPIVKCQKESDFKGVIGLDVFFKNEQSLFLNFSEKTVNNISEKQLNELIKEDFHKIKSECKSKKVYIYLTINEVEYKFKLDTGFSGSFVIPYNDKLNFDNFSYLEYEGSLFTTAVSSSNGVEKFYEDVPLKIGNNELYSTVLVSNSIKNQNIGLFFMKGFDWIIDYKNNNVYIRKNNQEIKSKNNTNAFRHLAKVNDEGNLIISAKQKKYPFNLNDRITSVNGVEINEDNICEMMNLLNTTTDWEILKIKIEPHTPNSN